MKQGQKRTLGALAVGLCAVGVAVGSGANFSAESVSPGNMFATGSLSIDSSRDGAAILSEPELLPGGAAKIGTVDITNTGTVNAVFLLTRDGVTSTDGGAPNPAPFASKLNMTITDCGRYPAGSAPAAPACGDADDAPVYAGTLGAENTGHGLGMYQPGERHRFRFTAALDGSAGNEYANDSATARYVFRGDQR